MRDNDRRRGVRMSRQPTLNRRHFLGSAALGVASLGTLSPVPPG